MTIKIVYIGKCDEPLCLYETLPYDEQFDAEVDLDDHVEEIHGEEDDDEE